MKTPSNYARSLRFAGLVTMIAAATAVQACSSDKIVAAPSSVTGPSAPASPTSNEVRVSGTVTNDEGLAVAGVKVTIYNWSNGSFPSSAITDAMGFYSVSSRSGDGMSAFTEKEGYESKWHNRTGPAPGHFRFDLRIQRIRQ